MKTKIVHHGYSVLVKARHGHFLAYKHPARFFAERYRYALVFKKELERHLESKCKVVKASVTYEYESEVGR